MPKYTNEHDLPAPLYRALCVDTYRGDPRTISVTQLINSPRIVALRQRHAEEITVDASKNLWSLLGSAVHYVLEHATGEDDIAEVRLRKKFGDVTISGMTDLYNSTTEHLYDFKITGTYAFLLEGKNYTVLDKDGMVSEAGPWTAQVNLNAMLYRNAGFLVQKGSIVAILRDWNSSKAKQDKNYPQAAFYVLDIPLWTQEQCVDYAQKRIALHVAQHGKTDDELTPCTPDERWMRAEAWAVQKEGNLKASAVEETEEKAKNTLLALLASWDRREQEKYDTQEKERADNPRKKEYKKKPAPKYEIVHRPGRNLRCESFCEVREFCNFYKEHVAPNLTPEEEENEDSTT